MVYSRPGSSNLISSLIFGCGCATSNFIYFSFSTLASVSIRNRESIVIAQSSLNQGWRMRSCESTRLPPTWRGFNSRRRRHMWVKNVVGSFLCSERFFSGYSGFPLSSKTNISKFQFDQESGRRRTTMWMCHLQIVIHLFIYHNLRLIK